MNTNPISNLSLLHTTDSETRRFMMNLEQFVIVDIGTISSVYHDGTVDVRTGRVIGGTVVTYTHVELLAPGSSVGTFSSVPTAGSTCLVFSPRTSIPSTADMNVGMNQPYSIVGMKAVMLSRPLPTMVRAGYDYQGNFILQGTDGGALMCVAKDGDLVVSAGTLHVYIQKDGTMVSEWPQRSTTTDPTGIQTDQWYNPDGYIIREEVKDPTTGDTTITIFDGTKDKKILHSDTVSLDGSSQTQVTDPDGNVLYNMVISPEGQMDLTVGKDPGATISITPDGAMTIEIKKACSFKTEDAFTLETSKAVSIKSQDAITVEATADCTVKGQNVTVEAQAQCSVKGNAGVEVNSPQVKITGGMLSVNGTAAPTGSGPFCGVPACLFTGAPHVGNMVSGT